MSASSSSGGELGTNIPVAPVVCGGLAIFGVVILVGGIVLHRRHKRILQQEDMTTNYSPADYGLLPTPGIGTDLTHAEDKTGPQSRARSMELESPSPYSNLHSTSLQSRESLNTIVRSEEALQPYRICSTLTSSSLNPLAKCSKTAEIRANSTDLFDVQSYSSSLSYSEDTTAPLFPKTYKTLQSSLPAFNASNSDSPSRSTTSTSEDLRIAQLNCHDTMRSPIGIQNKVRESILQYAQFSAQDYNREIDDLEIGMPPNITIAAPLALKPRTHRALQEPTKHNVDGPITSAASERMDRTNTQLTYQNREVKSQQAQQRIPELAATLKALPLSPSQVDLNQTFYSATFQNRSRSVSPGTFEISTHSSCVRVKSPFLDTDEKLSSLPSPYHLRQSGTFSALDFAPTNRMHSADTTYVSSAKVKAGRLSRIEGLPKKENIGELLKPSWQQAR